jgi:hypothetical protein
MRRKNQKNESETPHLDINTQTMKSKKIKERKRKEKKTNAAC